VDRAQAEQATEAAAEALDQAVPHVTIDVAADASAAEIIAGSGGQWCPARPAACAGRPAVRIAVPVRVVRADPRASQQIGAKVGEVTAVYCPLCRSMKADQAPAAADAAR
jgi:hypothetical protein